MRVLFWGTPDFAVPSLRALGEEGHQVVGVVTQPDRPAGRGRQLRPSPVKECALADGLRVLTPELPRGEEFMAEVRALEPEISVVVAYGHILRREVLDIPSRGSINVHASLLPALRGAAPIHWAVARGHDQTGVTIMRMVEAMDAGPILHRIVEPIGARDTSTELTARLSGVGAQALLEALTLMEFDDLDEVEQDHDAATYAPKVGRVMARIDWTRSAEQVVDHVRALDSVPGAWTTLDDAPLKLFGPWPRPHGDAEDAPEGSGATPGTVIDAGGGTGRGLGVMAGDGPVWFAEVQPPGKRRMEADAWLVGRGVDVGARFE